MFFQIFLQHISFHFLFSVYGHKQLNLYLEARCYILYTSINQLINSQNKITPNKKHETPINIGSIIPIKVKPPKIIPYTLNLLSVFSDLSTAYFFSLSSFCFQP